MGDKKKNLPKKAFVTLKAKGKYNRKHDFELQHALRLLRLPNSGWELDDERYTFEKNDIRRVTSTSTDNSTKK